MKNSYIRYAGLIALQATVLLPVQSLIGQVSCDFYDDYSDPAPWHSVYIFPGISPCSETEQSGSLSVTGGVVNFDNVNDGSDTRIWRDLGFSVSDVEWTANFEFTPTIIGPTGTPAVGHVIFSLTDGDNCPWNDSTYHCELSNQDGITIWYLSAYSATASTTGFYIYAKNGDIGVSSWGIDWIAAGVGQTYYMTLKRIATNYLTLEAYNDPDRTDLFGSIDCFEIPDDITNLHTLQHANAPWGFWMRHLTGTMDNTCIYDNSSETAYILGPDTVCNGDEMIYAISSGGSDYTWNLPPEVIYTLTVDNAIDITDWGGLSNVHITATIDAACSPYEISFDVEVLDAFLEMDTTEICAGDTLYALGLAITDAGTYSQTFTTAYGCDSTIQLTVFTVDTLFSSENVSACSGDTIYIFGNPVISDGSYTEEYISAAGCDSLHTINVHFIESFFTSETIHICAGEAVIIFGNIETDAGIYSQTFTSVDGCDSTSEITLVLDPSPNITFTEDTLIVTTNDGVIITPGISGSIVNYFWYPEAWLSCSDCPETVLTATTDGWIYLEVIDANGCTDIDSIYVLTNFAPAIDLPNAFSPNGDGINDFFNVVSNGMCNLDAFQIYNRWGQMIFESNNISTGWDGSYLDEEQEIGTYVYLVFAHCDLENVILKGTVTLVR